MKKWFLLIAAILLIPIIWVIWHYQQAVTPVLPEKPVQPEKPLVGLQLKKVSFSQLPDWQSANLKESLNAFKVSCKVLLRQAPDQDVGSPFIPMKAQDWQPACKAAMKLPEDVSTKKIRKYFEQWFKPMQFVDKEPVEGLFTGYYSPLLEGSFKKTKKFSVPIFARPNDMITVNLGLFKPEYQHRKVVGRLSGNQLIPYYSREEINNGAIDTKAPVVVWVANRIDRLFLEIQGSGAIELPDKELMYLGYDGENGASYTSVAQVLINKGVMTKDNASMQAIRKYLLENPEEMDVVLHKNKSFVFFRSLGHNAAYGAQGVNLIPQYSLAVDRKYIPLGTPIWLSTTRPDAKHDDKQIFRRLMIAQDTGGAIRGPVRGDVYWGAGEEATHIAGHMKNKGFYWLLLPKSLN